MLNLLSPYKYALDAVVIGLLLAAAAFGVHHYNTYQQGIGETRVQAQWDKAALAAKEAQRLREIQFQKEKDDAIAQASKTVQVANAAATAANQSGRMLDATLQTLITRSGSDSIDADRKYIAALSAVLGECQAVYREVAKSADRHAADSLMYQNAWPGDKK